jgi:hypothetical protein
MRVQLKIEQKQFSQPTKGMTNARPRVYGFGTIISKTLPGTF